MMHGPFLILVLVVLAVIVLVWRMRRLGLRAQFMALLVLGILTGFFFLVLVQLPHFPHWLAISLIVMVFVASQFAVRFLIQSLKKDEQDEEAAVHQR